MTDNGANDFCPVIDCYNLSETSIQAYPDISGNGVLIGFMGTAYLVLLLVIGNYFLAYDPTDCPFNSGNSKNESINRELWRPNPIDERFLRWVRKGPLVFTDDTCARLRMAFDEFSCVCAAIFPVHLITPIESDSIDSDDEDEDEDDYNDNDDNTRSDDDDDDSKVIRSIIMLCDVQVVTGLGILISGFVLLRCGLDAIHWQIAVFLAWFSTVTHLSGLTVLRTHLNTYVWSKHLRFSLMFLLLILLLVGIVPTGFFSLRNKNFSSPAVCYFDLKYGFWRFNETLSQSDFPEAQLERTPAYQAMVYSMVLLVLGFGTRSMKLLHPLSRTFKLNVRKPMSRRMRRLLTNFSNAPASSDRRKMLRTELILKPALAGFFMVRLTSDFFSSSLFEVYWLCVILVWGTIKLLGTRNELLGLIVTAVDEDQLTLAEAENQWTFGQILPVILLFGPVFTIFGTFVHHITKPDSADSQPQQHDVYSDSGSNGAAMSGTTVAPSRATSFGQESTKIASKDAEPTENAADSPAGSYDADEAFHQAIPHLEDYRCASWLPVCAAFPFLGLLAAVMMAFAASFVFNNYFQPGLTLYDLWISDLNFVCNLFISYPCACATTIRLGLWMEGEHPAKSRIFLSFLIGGSRYHRLVG
ncbi:hypothetical protein CGLO_04880 [Colletotrichum gloeosporioides Cg-14]|uniref:Uncharacterized protein n=1 Tax=Colletotrichum gloeosporioides (strain Cg-14) TaxID=1237896 RepID=T0KIM8_COLGC|nr:hypothetical protein CGLO_04880 [Colletotrichum gloeosporioides Cg-14]